MRQSLARFSGSVSSIHAASSVDCITTMVGFKVFGTHTLDPRTSVHGWAGALRRQCAAAIPRKIHALAALQRQRGYAAHLIAIRDATVIFPPWVSLERTHRRSRQRKSRSRNRLISEGRIQ
jgi:hypothetical protein